MEIQRFNGMQNQIGYKVRYLDLPDFSVVGFTKIVRSGGEQYSSVRKDGRWEVLKSIASEDNKIYGVASLDKQCPKGFYRYTIGVRGTADNFIGVSLEEELFKIHIGQSIWVVFELTNFSAQYGEFWSRDPYKRLPVRFMQGVCS